MDAAFGFDYPFFGGLEGVCYFASIKENELFFGERPTMTVLDTTKRKVGSFKHERPAKQPVKEKPSPRMILFATS